MSSLEEEEGRVLALPDFRWRVARVAEERGAWWPEAMISTPALAGERPWEDVADVHFVVLLFESEGAGAAARIRAPRAVVGLRPDGDVAFFESLSEGRGAVATIGPRYGETAAQAAQHQRVALLETYYFALTEPEGPLWNPWSKLPFEHRHDLGSFFDVCVEPPLRPYYERYAAEFLKLVAPS